MRAAPGERRDRSSSSGGVRKVAARKRRDEGEGETGNAGSGGTSANSRGSSEARPGSEAGVREGPPTRPDPAGSGGTRRARTSPASADPSRTGSPTWRSAAKEAAPRPRAGTDRCPQVEAATARGGHRRRACSTARRVQGGRRATNTRAAATIARGGSKGRRKPPRRAHRATSARRARRRRAGRGARNGRRLRRCPRRRRECRGSRGGRNRPAPSPVCGVSLSSSARGIYHIIRRYDAVVERRVETCM